MKKRVRLRFSSCWRMILSRPNLYKISSICVRFPLKRLRTGFPEGSVEILSLVEGWEGLAGNSEYGGGKARFSRSCACANERSHSALLFT